jgi:hypothetical protein
MKMKVVTILIILALLALAVFSPWRNLNINLGNIFGVKNTSETSTLEVSSLGGKLKVFLDGNEVGSTNFQDPKLEISPITSGNHTLKLMRDSDVSYPSFEKTILFAPGISSSISYELGLSEDISNGWLIVPVKKVVKTTSTDTDITFRVLPEDSVLSINGEKKDSKVVKLDPKTKYDVRITKEGYLPQSFQILGFDDSKVKQSSDYEYIVDVKLGSIPLKVESK